MTQTRDLIKKMADFFTGEEFYEKGEDARLELSPDDVRCMNVVIKACGNAISRQAVDTLVDELARAISDERCCISRGRSTATIMQDILDLPSVIPKYTEITLESAIDYLNSIGWMQEHDRILTESAQSVTQK